MAVTIYGDGKIFAGKDEELAISDDQVFTITSPINMDQLKAEIEEAVGISIMAGTYPSDNPHELFSPSNPLELTVVATNTHESVKGKVAEVIKNHQPSQG